MTFWPPLYDDSWRCPCGTRNAYDAAECRACSVTRGGPGALPFGAASAGRDRGVTHGEPSEAVAS